MVSFKRFAQCNCRALIKAIDAYVEKADKGIEQALEAGGYAQPKETTQRIKALEEELTEALKNEFTLTVSSLNDCEDLREFYNQAWPERRDSNEIVERLSRTFESTFEEVIPDFTAEYIKRVEADAATSTVSLLKETVSWIRSWSARLAELMKLTDNKTIQGILDKGLREGRSVQQVSEDIHSSGLREYGYRARRVATTELLRAHSVAQQESFMQSPVVTSKMWKHSGWRTYARKNHMKSAESGGVNGQIVQKDQTFTLTGANGTIYYPMYPRDSSLPPGESINCGCVCQPVVDESILGMSLEERNRLRDEAIKELNEDFDKKLDDQNSAQAFARRDPEEWKRERAGESTVDNSGKSDMMKEGENPLKMDLQFFADRSKQYGKKIGKHASDFGLDPSNASDRQKMRDIINDIVTNSTEVRTGPWNGQDGDVLFYIKGNDAVLKKKNGEFITVIKNGAKESERIKNARTI